MDVPTTTIPVLLPSGDVKNYSLFDSRDPKIDTVYLVKEYPDGSRFAFNKAYDILGRLTMSDEDFTQLTPLIIQTDHSYTGGADHMPGDAFWFDMDERARATQIGWARQKYKEDHPGQELSSP